MYCTYKYLGWVCFLAWSEIQYGRQVAIFDFHFQAITILNIIWFQNILFPGDNIPGNEIDLGDLLSPASSGTGDIDFGLSVSPSVTLVSVQ